MPRDSVESVRGTYAEWSQGNMRAGIDLFDPDIAFAAFMPDANEPVLAHGADGIEAFMREFLRQWRSYCLFADEITERDGKVLAIGRQTAIGRESGIAVEYPMCSAWTFRDEKVVQLVFNPDPEVALGTDSRAIAERAREDSNL